MIYFLNKYGETIRQGNIGDNITPNYLRLGDIEYVQADGDELCQCLTILDRTQINIRVFTFCGDEARTIAANWI